MERLTDDRFLKDGFYQPKSKDEEKEIRSMGKDLTFEKLYKHCAEVEKENAELQKQVDEFNKRESSIIEYVENNVRNSCPRCKENTVKDTAKEIFEWLQEHLAPTPNGLCILQTYLKERYGVEVE